MNTLQIIGIVVSVVVGIITCTLAWIAVRQVSKVQVTFSGTPVDKKDFDAFVNEVRADRHAAWAKMEMDVRGTEATLTRVEKSIGALEAKVDATQTAIGVLNINFLNRKDK